MKILSNIPHYIFRFGAKYLSYTSTWFLYKFLDIREFQFDENLEYNCNGVIFLHRQLQKGNWTFRICNKISKFICVIRIYQMPTCVHGPQSQSVKCKSSIWTKLNVIKTNSLMVSCTILRTFWGFLMHIDAFRAESGFLKTFIL